MSVLAQASCTSIVFLAINRNSLSRTTDDAEDPILYQIRHVNLLNNLHDRVQIIFYSDFSNSNNQILGLDYEEFVQGCHLGVFSSYFEPWEHTPAEQCTVVFTGTRFLDGYSELSQPTSPVLVVSCKTSSSILIDSIGKPALKRAYTGQFYGPDEEPIVEVDGEEGLDHFDYGVGKMPAKPESTLTEGLGCNLLEQATTEEAVMAGRYIKKRKNTIHVPCVISSSSVSLGYERCRYTRAEVAFKSLSENDLQKADAALRN
ncbi:hypothetical protein K435DRAFT_963979 [Dendrothele bispora CBS 962.96]|uniref:Glycogen [starch] synthase n=1 Tax=Dendrothele bispora (strain CBS 962.96) TaxID=1314807 RepID=A0A4S8MDD4_DENBC|nr:hypothetical protein K435DRAFT_963979 [Dendrothele bispora CBS 962.96]